MGGGGAMRAAAKVAGIGVANGGLHRVSAENPVVSAARRATRPASISTPGEVKSSGVMVASQKDVIVDAGVQRPCWDIDDWDFAGVEEDMIVQPREPMPRLVFAGAPTLQEAKKATSELKDALEKAYLSSPNSSGCGDSYISGHESGLSLLSKPKCPETKACVTSETTVASVPKNALKAFRLLNESSAAQVNVVASIASDPNVWHAVLQNEALVEYLQSQKSTAAFSEMETVVKESGAKTALLDHESPKSADGSYALKKSAHPGNGFMDLLQNMKTTVVDMVTSLSDYFQNLFGGTISGKACADVDGSAGPTFVDKAVGASFMGLAVMVIMAVMLKRA